MVGRVTCSGIQSIALKFSGALLCHVHSLSLSQKEYIKNEINIYPECLIFKESEVE